MVESEAWLAHQRARWMRPDAHRWIRPDVARFLKPGTDPASVYPALARKYSPNQPRVPAGNGLESGRWTDGEGGIGALVKPMGNVSIDGNVIPDDPPSSSTRLAQVIKVCIVSGASRITDAFGNKTYNAIYDCVGGRTFTRSGNGHNIPGLVRDPFQ
jgi:hypothetical protein